LQKLDIKKKPYNFFKTCTVRAKKQIYISTLFFLWSFNEYDVIYSCLKDCFFLFCEISQGSSNVGIEVDWILGRKGLVPKDRIGDLSANACSLLRALIK
jgi:competence CoiA-like predicted nuclease